MFNKNSIITFGVAFLLAYLLGTAILNLIDNRLSDISINMPKIVLPKNDIKIVMDDKYGIKEYSSTLHAKKQGSEYRQNGGRDSQYRQTGGRDSQYHQNGGRDSQYRQNGGRDSQYRQTGGRCDITDPNRGYFEIHKYHSVKAPTKSPKVDHVNKSSGKVSNMPNPCNLKYKPPMQKIYFGGGEETKYIDTEEMTPYQQFKFKKYAKPQNMTLRDYERWVKLHSDDPENLPEDNNTLHIRNLRILLRGGKLTPEDMPKKRPPTAHEFYQQAYVGINQPEKQTDGPLSGYNMDDYATYSTPAELKHLKLVGDPDKANAEVLDKVRPGPSRKPKKMRKIENPETDDIPHPPTHSSE